MSDRKPLTPQRIADAALALIDRHGLEALSTRRLGAALGVEAMALYHHLRSKAALLDLVAERLLAKVVLPGPELAWDDWLVAVARAYRGVAQRHPNAFPLLAMRRFTTPATFSFLEAVLAVLARAGFDPAGQAQAFRTLGYFLNGAALADRAALGPSPLPKLTDPALPRSRAVAPYLQPSAHDALFEFGLGVVMDGIRRIRPGSAPPPAARPRRARAPRPAAPPG